MAKKEKRNAPLWRTILEALLIAGFIHTFLFRPFFIPSSSMKPNLLIGDYVIINKFSYGFSCYSPYIPVCSKPGRIFGSDPKAGDVIVFSNPADNRAFVKRLIGVPGDRVQMRDGKLYLNGDAVQFDAMEPYAEPKADYGGEPYHIREDETYRYIEQFQETLPNGYAHSVFNASDTARFDNTQEWTVPEGHYFVRGDNRDNSDDSRGQVGFLPEERIIGKAKLIVFSSSGTSLFQVHKWRKDRLFKWVR